MATSTKRKRVACTIEQKVSVLQRLDKGESVTKIASEIEVGIATIRLEKKHD